MFREPFFSSVDSRAQAMVEVAIFGVIIISIIGMIVKNVVSTSFAQQQALRIVREALSEAEKEQRLYDPTLGYVRVQKPYNLLVIEDRLTTGVTKYGVTERMPYSFRANGVFSRDLLGGVYDLANVSESSGTYGTFNIPVLNMKINGILFPFALGAWRYFPEAENCQQPVRRTPGAGVAWETKPLNEEEFQEIMDAQGSVPCWKTEGYLVQVFAKPFSATPPEYHAIDPSLTQAPAGYLGVINPFRGSELGLDKQMVIQTTGVGSLTVQPDQNKSTAQMVQTDVIRRGVRTNSGYVWAITRLSGTRSHPW